MARCAGGGIMWSSVATRYQLGFVRHAGSLIVPLSASTPHGTCESAMNAASSDGRAAGERGPELLAVEEQEPLDGREDRRHRRAGRGVGDQGTAHSGLPRP